MNIIEKMNQARAELAPAQRIEIDEGQRLLDKAQRLAEEAAQRMPVKAKAQAQPPVESEAARQTRLTNAMSDARNSKPPSS
jgi:hypothetical protein